MMKKVWLLLCSVAFLTAVGCGPSKPDAVIAPSYSPDSIALKAMELYDKDGDKKLSANELKACPSMLWSLKSIDTDGDGAISDAEIRARIQGWIDRKVALTCPTVEFQLKSGKVAQDTVGKNVVLTPDPMMGDLLKASKPAIIDDYGRCYPSSPENQDNLDGMSYGFYNISIEGVSYSNLGVEIFDRPDIDMGAYVIELPKKGK